MDIIDYVIIMTIVLISALLNIVIHEVGHMVGGLISGYKLVFIRVGSYTWIKEENGWITKKFNIVGTAGQCIMEPPKDKPFTYRLYFLGGIIGNLILVIIGFFLYALITSPIGRTFAIEFIFLGFYFIVINGIPLKIGGLVNDGYHVFRMKKEDARKLYAQIKISIDDIKGIRIKDMDETYFECNEDNPNNIYDCYIIMVKALRYIECHEYNQAKLLLKRVIDSKTISFYKCSAINELLLIEIEEKGRDADIHILDKKTKKYIKKQSYSLSCLLLQYSLACINHDKKAEKIEQKFLNYSKETIEQGEVEMNLNRYKNIKQKLM